MKKINLQLFAEVLPKNTITPELNYETEAFINTTPGTGTDGGAATWASLAALTKNMAESLNEVLYQASYYADQGWGSTEVVGAQLTLTLTGDCKPSDPAYEYITSEKVMYGLGEARKTHMKLTKGDKYGTCLAIATSIGALFQFFAQFPAVKKIPESRSLCNPAKW